MKTSIFAILVAAATLGLSLSLPAGSASAAKSNHDCARTHQADCSPPTGGNADQGQAMDYRTYYGERHMMYGTRPGYDGRMMPTSGPASGDQNPCSNITGGGSGTPAYLYGKCF